MTVETVLRSVARRVVPAAIRRRTDNTMFSRPGDYLQARRTTRDWRRHYEVCQRRYRADGHDPAPVLTDLRVLTLSPPAPSSPVVLPPNYGDLFERVRFDIADKLSWSAGSSFHPTPKTMAERTLDTPGVQQGDVLIQKLRDHLHIDGLEALCRGLMPLIERAVYGSYVLVDKVYVMRTYASTFRTGSTWLWHYDEHPSEMLKLLIYLTDVDEGSAPFTYLVDPNGNAVLGSAFPLFGQSRIPEADVQALVAHGCRPHSVTGSAGTCVLFNDNVIHRATFAERGYRDALFLQLRPSPVPRLPYVDARWTGSDQHRDYNRDPEDLQPVLR